MPASNPDYTRINELIENNEHDEAVSFAETCLEEYGDDPELMLLLVEACIYSWNLKRADDLLLVLQEKKLSREHKKRFTQLRIHYYVNCARMELTGEMKVGDEITIEYPKTKESWEKAVRFYNLAKLIREPDEENKERLEKLETVTVGLTDFMETAGQSDDEEDEMDPGVLFDLFASTMINNDDDDEPDYYSEYSAEDELAHQKVREVFELWGEKTSEDGEVTRSPDNYRQIRKTDKILAQIAQLNYSHPKVKEIVENITEVNNYYREVTPDTRKIMFSSVAISLGVLALLWVTPMLLTYNAPNFTYNADDWILYRNAEMWFDSSVRESDTELHDQKRILSAGTQLTPIARIQRNWIQVRTPDGDKGFVHYNNFKGAQQVTLTQDAPVMNRSTNQAIDTLRAGTTISLTHFENKPWENRTSAQVRTPSGKTGEIDYWRSGIRFPMLTFLPHLNQTYTYPTRKDRLDEFTAGSELAELEKVYGPASSIMRYKDGKVAYFRQIEYTDQKKRFNSVYFTMDESDKITGFSPRYDRRYGITERLPLVQTMRFYQPFGINKLSYYEAADGEPNMIVRWWNAFTSYHWLTKILSVILQLALALVVIFLIFSIPRLIVSPAIYITTNWRKLTNKQVRMVNTIAILTSFYLFWIWVSLASGSSIESFIASIFLIGFWRRRDYKNIYYNRCPDCHTMNVSQPEGSDFKGTSQEVQWSTYDVYKGSRTHGNVTTNYYDRRWKSKTTTYEHYDDHMSCRRCGHQWTVERTEKRGSRTERH